MRAVQAHLERIMHPVQYCGRNQAGQAATEVLTVRRSTSTSHFAIDSSLHEILVDSALWGDMFIICVVGVQVSTVLGYCRILSGLLAVANRFGSIVPVRARWEMEKRTHSQASSDICSID